MSLETNLEGTQLPNIKLYEDNTQNTVYLQDVFKGKKGILLGMQGAFTPVCSSKHLPSFLQNFDQIRQKGYDVIACVAVNDGYTMGAWSKSLNVNNKIRMLGDPQAEFTRAIHMDQEFPELGGVRSKRYTMLIDNNVIKRVFVDSDACCPNVSLANNVIQHL